jgi:beta-N-acetylhexosaminidase
MNVNLAPVLDVFRKPGDFDDQFERSYSNDPKVVSTLGAAFVRAQQAAGVAATAKHFPGLGAASAKQNTDQVPVTLRLSTRTLRSVDESPYKSSIGAGVKLVMVSWATYPTLDARRPAGLSSKIVQGELRGRLGFQGVTVTDAIEAGALRSFGSDGNRGVLAAGAGMDLILYSAQDVTQGVSGVTALTDALNSGRLDPAAFRLAVKRVLALRQSLA